MDQTLTEIVSRAFDEINPFSEKQGGLVNAFQNDDFLNDLLIIGFIVAYGLALQIAISGVFRKLIIVFCILMYHLIFVICHYYHTKLNMLSS